MKRARTYGRTTHFSKSCQTSSTTVRAIISIKDAGGYIPVLLHSSIVCCGHAGHRRAGCCNGCVYSSEAAQCCCCAVSISTVRVLCSIPEHDAGTHTAQHSSCGERLACWKPKWVSSPSSLLLTVVERAGACDRPEADDANLRYQQDDNIGMNIIGPTCSF